MRTSLLGAGLAGLGEAGNRDSFAFDGVESGDGWEFSTLRSSTFEPISEAEESDASQIPPHLRSHPLLRIFDNENNSDAYGGYVPPPMPNFANPVDQEVPPSPSTPMTLQGSFNHASPPDATTTRSAGSSLSQGTAKASTAAAPKPPLPTARPAQAENKSGFTGTGHQPFRFGGGGGGAEVSQLRRLPRDAPAEAQTIKPSAKAHREDFYQSDATTASAASSREDLNNASGNASSGSGSTTSLPFHLRSASQSSHKRGKSSVSSLSSAQQSIASSSQSPVVDQGGFEKKHEAKGSFSKLMRFAGSKRVEGLRGMKPPFSRSISEQTRSEIERPLEGPTREIIEEEGTPLTSPKRLRTGSAPETPPHSATKAPVGLAERVLEADLMLASGSSSSSMLQHVRLQHGGSDPTLRSSTDAAGQLSRLWRERSASQQGGAPESVNAHVRRQTTAIPVVGGGDANANAHAAVPLPKELTLVGGSNLDTTSEEHLKRKRREGGEGQGSGTVMAVGSTPDSASFGFTTTPTAQSQGQGAAAGTAAARIGGMRSASSAFRREASEPAGSSAFHATAPMSAAVVGSNGRSHQPRNGSGLSAATNGSSNFNGLLDTPLSPLDLVQLNGKEEVNAELGRKVEEVGKWLDLLSQELGRMLE